MSARPLNSYERIMLGQRTAKPTIPCPKCDGNGSLYHPGSWRTSECTRCKGAGAIVSERKTCWACDSKTPEGCDDCQPERRAVR